MNDKIKKPELEQKIYVPSSFHVYSGEDDFVGGIATISKIEYSNHLPECNINYIMIGIKECKKTMYNYRILMTEQSKLKKIYGNQIAHPDPDLRPEFNCINADWTICNDKL